MIGESFSTQVEAQPCRFKKIVCNPQGNAIQFEDCIDLTRIAKFVQLNTSALSNPNSLFVTLSLFTYSLSLSTQDLPIVL